MREDVQALHDRLRPLQEKKGYYFSSDAEMLESLLEGLLVNKERYGYMSCPCRLAVGDRDLDRDIICPCDYREPDVAEFGSCYCALYVSLEWREGAVPHDPVPERRPPSRLPY